jgi:hypothetical protein
MAHHENQGVAVRAAAPFSLDCEVIVKLTLGMNFTYTALGANRKRGILPEAPGPQTTCKSAVNEKGAALFLSSAL